VEQLSYVLRVVAACFWDLEGLLQPVLLQMLRVRVVVELLQHLADLRACRDGMTLLCCCLCERRAALRDDVLQGGGRVVCAQ